MCNSQTQQFIDQVVSNKVNSDVMFTLFDVTLEVQALEKAANMTPSRHRHIHDDVATSANQEALGNGWNRQTRPMGGNLVALVYYNPAVHDVATYAPLARKDSPSAAKNTNPALDGVNPAALAFASQPVSAPNATSPTSPTSTVLGAPAADGYKNVDRWNRLRLPCEVMRAAGFLPGDMVYAVGDNGKLTFTKSTSTTNPALTIAKYIVDCHCNIRVTPRTLNAAGLSATSYKLTASTGNVTVEP